MKDLSNDISKMAERRKKSFWKHQKEAIIAKKEKKNAGDDDPEILQIESELQGIFNSSSTLIDQVNNFIKNSQNYINTKRKLQINTKINYLKK